MADNIRQFPTQLPPGGGDGSHLEQRIEKLEERTEHLATKAMLHMYGIPAVIGLVVVLLRLFGVV